MKRKPLSKSKSEILAGIHRDKALREQSYRERALKLFPHICGRCGREFSGKRLRELTVHHIDHNHTNNPPDGSNWELLCLYCHDNEHETPERTGIYDDDDGPGGANEPTLHYNPFEALKHVLPDAIKPEKPEEPDSGQEGP